MPKSIMVLGVQLPGQKTPSEMVVTTPPELLKLPLKTAVTVCTADSVYTA